MTNERHEKDKERGGELFCFDCAKATKDVACGICHIAFKAKGILSRKAYICDKCKSVCYEGKQFSDDLYFADLDSLNKIAKGVQHSAVL